MNPRKLAPSNSSTTKSFGIFSSQEKAKRTVNISANDSSTQRTILKIVGFQVPGTSCSSVEMFWLLKNSWDKFSRGSDHWTLKYKENVMLQSLSSIFSTSEISIPVKQTYSYLNFEGLEQDEDIKKELNVFGFPTSYGYT